MHQIYVQCFKLSPSKAEIVREKSEKSSGGLRINAAHLTSYLGPKLLRKWIHKLALDIFHYICFGRTKCEAQYVDFSLRKKVPYVKKSTIYDFIGIEK